MYQPSPQPCRERDKRGSEEEEQEETVCSKPHPPGPGLPPHADAGAGQSPPGPFGSAGTADLAAAGAAAATAAGCVSAAAAAAGHAPTAPCILVLPVWTAAAALPALQVKISVLIMTTAINSRMKESKPCFCVVSEQGNTDSKEANNTSSNDDHSANTDKH